MKARRIVLAALVVVSIPACRRGPHLQLVTPSAPSPTFGDAPSVASESMHRGGGGGGGGITTSDGDPTGSGRSSGSVVGPAIGGAIGVGAAGVAIANGLVECRPGEIAGADAGVLNLCSGERRAAPARPGE